MARRGLFSRIRGLFRRATQPPPEPPREPPREPPSGPDTPPGIGREERLYRQAWTEHTLERAGRRYRIARDLFNSMPLMFDSEQDRFDTWELFLENIVTSGRYRRNDIHNDFWQATGMNPKNFDWDEFRRLMAGSPKTGRRG